MVEHHIGKQQSQAEDNTHTQTCWSINLFYQPRVLDKDLNNVNTSSDNKNKTNLWCNVEIKVWHKNIHQLFGCA